MAKRILPALADLSQDIAGTIPVDLILRWATGQRSREMHRKLLKPYTIYGTAVSSDSAGLSRLSLEKTLLEVLQLVSQPKEIIFAYGKKIGGRAIGMWIADNTEMFYGSGISPQSVLEQMLSAQQEINHLSVKVGLGIHTGEYIDIGGGLFGDEADFIEDVAENYTEGGEVVVSLPLKEKLHLSHASALSLRADLRFKIPVYRVNYEHLNISGVKDSDTRYPHPFDQNFFDYLTRSPLADPAVVAEIKKNYSVQTNVLLFKIRHRRRKLLLDQLTDWVIANSLINKQLQNENITKIKSNGSLGIFICNEIKNLIEFAMSLKAKLEDTDFSATFGMSGGEVFLFPISKSIKEIAGSPVNIASKLAEDVGKKNAIYMDDSINIPPNYLPKCVPFSVPASHVQLQGNMLI